jgi:hypothetical protein
MVRLRAPAAGLSDLAGIKDSCLAVGVDLR